MKEVLRTITAKNRVTLPKDVRKRLGVSTKDKVLFVIEDDGTVKLRVPPYPTVASLAGAAGKLEHPRSWNEMREIAREDRRAL